MYEGEHTSRLRFGGDRKLLIVFPVDARGGAKAVGPSASCTPMAPSCALVLLGLLPSVSGAVCAGDLIRNATTHGWFCGAMPFNATSIETLTDVSGVISLLNDAALTQAEFPMLSSVGSVLISGNAALKKFNMPLLTTAASLTVSNNMALGSFNATALATLSAVNITSNPSLVSFDFGMKLVTLQTLIVDDNRNLGNIRLDSLGHVSGLEVAGNDLLNTVNMTGLKSAGSVAVTGNNVLVQCQLGALANVTGNLLISANSNLNLVNLNSLGSVTGALAITQSASLSQTPMLGALTSVGSLQITANAALVTLAADALAAVDGAFNVSYNAALKNFSFRTMATAGTMHVIDNAAMAADIFPSLTSLNGPPVACPAGLSKVVLCMHGLKALEAASLPVRPSTPPPPPPTPQIAPPIPAPDRSSNPASAAPNSVCHSASSKRPAWSSLCHGNRSSPSIHRRCSLTRAPISWGGTPPAAPPRTRTPRLAASSAQRARATWSVRGGRATGRVRARPSRTRASTPPSLAPSSSLAVLLQPPSNPAYQPQPRPPPPLFGSERPRFRVSRVSSDQRRRRHPAFADLGERQRLRRLQRRHAQTLPPWPRLRRRGHRREQQRRPWLLQLLGAHDRWRYAPPQGLQPQRFARRASDSPALECLLGSQVVSWSRPTRA